MAILPISAALVNLVLPYHASIIEFPRDISFLTEDVALAKNGGLRTDPLSYWDPKTRQQISAKEAALRLEKSSRGRMLPVKSAQIHSAYGLSVVPGWSNPGISAAREGMKVGSMSTDNPRLWRMLEARINETLVHSVLQEKNVANVIVEIPWSALASSYPVAWIGSDTLPTPLPPLPGYALKRFRPGGERQDFNTKGTDGLRIAGEIVLDVAYAVYWDLGKYSADILHPVDARSSTAIAVDGDSIVGAVAYNGRGPSAALWTLPNRLTILAREGFAMDVKGEEQVGFVGRNPQAALWRGSSDSMINLHRFLPPQVTMSEAKLIGTSGAIFGVGKVKGKWVGLVWKRNPIYEKLRSGGGG